MLTDENHVLQINEVEALKSMYLDNFLVDGSSIPPTYTIIIGEVDRELRLSLTLPDEYPTNAPPSYSLNAPWLTLSQKQRIADKLGEIYLDNVGESILHLWIEFLRDFITDLACQPEQSLDPDSPVTADEESASSRFFLNHEAGMNTTTCSTSEDDCCSLPNSPSCPVPRIVSGDPLGDRKSTFQAHVAPVRSKQEVKAVLGKLLENKKIAAATHNIYAYRIVDGSVRMCDCEDDGEHKAGGKLLTLLEHGAAQNVLVVVTRWYGGIHLGPDRFHHINDRARILLQQEGYLPRREEGSKQGKKKKR